MDRAWTSRKPQLCTGRVPRLNMLHPRGAVGAGVSLHLSFMVRRRCRRASSAGSDEEGTYATKWLTAHVGDGFYARMESLLGVVREQAAAVAASTTRNTRVRTLPNVSIATVPLVAQGPPLWAEKGEQKGTPLGEGGCGQ